MPLLRWFRGRGPSPSSTGFTLNTVRVDAAGTGEHPDLLVQLERREVDAILVRGVLNPDEVARAVRELERVRDECPTEMFGHVLGMPLMRLGDGEQNRTPYHDATTEARAQLLDVFGFDVQDRISAILGKMSGEYAIEVPAEGGRPYNPGTARWYLPGQGGLYPHVGNEFVEQTQHGALTHLLTVNQVRDWMSWFMVLQRPDSGGTLTVYDLLHRDRPASIDDHETREKLFGELGSVTFDPEPGEMIVFCGGWRYHRVEDIAGARPRITYGGFMRPGLDRSSIHMWA